MLIFYPADYGYAITCSVWVVRPPSKQSGARCRTYVHLQKELPKSLLMISAPSKCSSLMELWIPSPVHMQSLSNYRWCVTASGKTYHQMEYRSLKKIFRKLAMSIRHWQDITKNE